MPMLPWGRRSENVRKAEELLRECCQRLDLEEKRLGGSGKGWISRRKWPEGDGSEMRRLMYYAALVSPGSVVEAVHFPPRSVRDHEAFADMKFGRISLEDLVGHKVSHFFESLGSVEVRDIYRTVLRQVERPLIKRCLEWAKWNQLKAARALGINRNTLRKKIQELGIEKGR